MALSWSQRRKLTYIGILSILPLFLIGTVLYRYVTRPPSCFDGRQNGLERGVDCGGGCQRVCSQDVSNLILRWQRAFYVDDDVYNLVAYIENQNTNVGVREIPFEFRVLDQANQIIGEPYVNFAYVGPNEGTAIFIPAFEVCAQQPAQVVFRFLRNPIWEKTDPKFAAPQLVVKNRVLSNETVRPKLVAEVENITFDDFSDVPVVALVFDADGNAMAASQSYIEFIGDGDRKEVTFTWPLPFERSVARVEVLPRINPFEPKRF